MSIAFSADRWEEVKDNYRRWWDGDLGRPILQLFGPDKDPGRDAPKRKNQRFISLHGLEAPIDDIIDTYDYGLSKRTFLMDAFPSAKVTQGPGSLAAYLGAELIPRPEERTVWFKPDTVADATDLSLLTYDENEPWYKQLQELYRGMIDRWQGLVQVSMAGLGGNLDVVSTFRPSETLLMDLYDCPEETKRLTWEAHEMWWRCFEHLNGILQPVNPGYTAWCPIFSETPYYILQCDFSYMIGPDMFDEFVKPELAASCAKLDHPFYHLDGPGQLSHLDSLLRIDNLRGVQWVPGAGAARFTEWPKVYQKIHAAGKKMQINGSLQDADTIAEQIGTAEPIMLMGSGATEEEISDFLRKWAKM